MSLHHELPIHTYSVIGGEFMFGKILSIILGFFCGMMFIRNLSIEHPFSVPEFLLDLILDPIQFFMAMFFFFVSFLANAHLLKNAIEETYALIKERKGNGADLIVSYFVFFVFWGLMFMGFWETFTLLCFTIIYSLLSVNVTSLKETETES